MMRVFDKWDFLIVGAFAAYLSYYTVGIVWHRGIKGLLAYSWWYFSVISFGVLSLAFIKLIRYHMKKEEQRREEWNRKHSERLKKQEEEIDRKVTAYQEAFPESARSYLSGPVIDSPITQREFGIILFSGFVWTSGILFFFSLIYAPSLVFGPFYQQAKTDIVMRAVTFAAISGSFALLISFNRFMWSESLLYGNPIKWTISSQPKQETSPRHPLVEITLLLIVAFIAGLILWSFFEMLLFSRLSDATNRFDEYAPWMLLPFLMWGFPGLSYLFWKIRTTEIPAEPIDDQLAADAGTWFFACTLGSIALILGPPIIASLSERSFLPKTMMGPWLFLIGNCLIGSYFLLLRHYRQGFRRALVDNILQRRKRHLATLKDDDRTLGS